MTRTLLGTTLVVSMVAALHAQSLHAQSLAGVAKKAEEERAKAKQADGKKDDKPPAKIYTNKDLPDAPPSTAPAASSESGSTTTPAAATTAPAATAPPATSQSAKSKDEDSWRARARELRRTLADDQTKLAAAKLHFDSLPDQAKGPLGTPVVDAWMRAREEISRLTAAVANDQRAISELEDDARRAGVPPGWLRDK